MDVDLDLKTSFDPMKIFPKWVKASLVKDGKLVSHPCGVYSQSIAKDPFTGLSAIPYDQAEELGYLKIDFLHNSVFNIFESRKEIEDLLKIEPNWTLLSFESTYPKLFQFSKHSELLMSLKPKSIEELADCMALIRPGKKKFLGLYKKDKKACRKILYSKDENGYAFKKSHAIAYAMNVVLQLHLIELGRL